MYLGIEHAVAPKTEASSNFQPGDIVRIFNVQYSV